MRERDKAKQPDQNWPFDPMQPGDPEPVRLPDELTDVEDEPKDLDPAGARPQPIRKR